MTLPEIELKNIDVIFGSREKEASELLAQGFNREEILSKTGTVIGVCEASILVAKGEICVLMGLSGSGKSTLLRTVNGLNKVTRGEVLLQHNGGQIDLAKVDEAQLREVRMNRVSMVFQQFGLLPWRTVSQNVGLGLELRGIPKNERNAIVDEKLEMVGLAQWKDKYAHELSGGMQQRVGLARAFATDADILLMDEPFSALDPLIRSRLQDELLQLQEKLHKTVLFVSHDLDEAIKLGSSIAIMDNGRIVQFGTPEDIVLNPVNQYVSDFVAHMNPVGVLRALSIMKPMSDLTVTHGVVELDSANIRLSLSDAGEVSEVYHKGQPIQVDEWETGMEPKLNVMYKASVAITMKQTIELRHLSGVPVLLYDSDGIAGIVDNEEIYAAILQRRKPAGEA